MCFEELVEIMKKDGVGWGILNSGNEVEGGDMEVDGEWERVDSGVGSGSSSGSTEGKKDKKKGGKEKEEKEKPANRIEILTKVVEYTRKLQEREADMERRVEELRRELEALKECGDGMEGKDDGDAAVVTAGQ